MLPQMQDAIANWEQSSLTLTTHTITGMHASARLACEMVQPAVMVHDLSFQAAATLDGVIHTISELALFSDGGLNDGTVTWGFVVIATTVRGCFLRIGHCCGCVPFSPDDSHNGHFLGALEPTSFSAELSGIAWSLRWCMQQFIKVPCSIYCDNESAVGCVAGRYAAGSDTRLVSLCATLVSIVRTHKGISIHHIKGHAGHPWNEYADSINTALMFGQIEVVAIGFGLQHIRTSAEMGHFTI